MAIRDWLRAMIVGADRGDSRVENVLVHYVGHGMFKANSEEHYLSINATDAEDRSMTSASLGALNDILLKNASKQRRVYLIDACFAAASIRNLMGAAEDAIEVNVGGIIGAWPEGDYGTRGVAALCSADRWATASAGGERRLTQFTDGLLRVLEAGDRLSRAGLSLRRAHQLLVAALKARYGEEAVDPVLVAPEDGNGGIAAAPIFPNAIAGRPSARLARLLDDFGADDADLQPLSHTGAANGHARTEGAEEAPTIEVATSSAGGSHELAFDSMVPEVGGETSDWNVAVGDAPARDMEATLSPEQRFRQAAYRFFRLPRSQKDEIARKLDPTATVDAGLPDLERYKSVLARAREMDRVDRLESMIVKAEGK
ncbi:MAG: hypothetical protein KIT82_18675 [Bradyrhizobium sp.]|nr:hypothetical protein [Bradyrhizobium sp.]